MTESQNQHHRWYDEDPALGKAIEQLRQAPDKHQAQIALNIIKIIVEHQTEASADGTVESLKQNVNNGESIEQQILRRRWYDINEVLHSAMQLLHDSPDELQKSLNPSIAQMIESSLAKHY